MSDRLQRFLDRIWKRIYRDSDCQCQSCKDVEENWMVIIDEAHARYLCDLEWDYASEWVFLNYRDTK